MTAEADAIGVMFMQVRAFQDYQQALAWYRKAARRCLLRKRIWASCSSRRHAQSDRQAIAWYRKAANRILRKRNISLA